MMNTNMNLTHGSHHTRADGLCLMEAVAMLGGEDHTAAPGCACPVLSAFGRRLNDEMGIGAQGDALRAKYLADLAPRLVGTRSTPEVEIRRALVFADGAVRVLAPLALEAAGLCDAAATLRALSPVVSRDTAANAANAANAADAARADADAYAARAADAAARAAYAAHAADAYDAAYDAAVYAAYAAADAADYADGAAAYAAAAADAAYDAAAYDAAADAAADAADAATDAADAATATATAGGADGARAWAESRALFIQAIEVSDG